MSTPTPPRSGLPRFFLDRNLGRYAVPRGLREAGVEVVALAERYGVPEDERVTDVRWMRDAAEAGEAVLMCDDAIRKKNPEERRVLIDVLLERKDIIDRIKICAYNAEEWLLPSSCRARSTRSLSAPDRHPSSSSFVRIFAAVPSLVGQVYVLRRADCAGARGSEPITSDSLRLMVVMAWSKPGPTSAQPMSSSGPTASNAESTEKLTTPRATGTCRNRVSAAVMLATSAASRD